jgi:pilus assembly protein FimV
LAEPASFEQAGMAFAPALNGLQARLEFRGDGKPYIALTGQTPVNDHFLDVIVEAQWPTGRLAMNYTLLVSPVGAPKAASGKGRGDETVMAPVVSPQSLASVMTPEPSNRGQTAEKAITVRAGDTASRLVLQNMPVGVSLDQMLLAMVRANPEAFIEGNVNLLREGAQVQLPNAQEAAQVSAEEARQTVIAQTVDFVAYARRLAQAPLKATETASREMTGKVGPEVQTTAPLQPAQDKLTLSKREVTADSAQARLAVEREIQDKTEQLAALKKNLETLNSLSATPNSANASPAELSALKAGLPAASEKATPTSLLEKFSQNPSVWAWVMALLAGMAGWVWLVRRRPDPHEDLFGATGSQPKAPTLAPTLQPFPSGLPPQFANLDLNLTPAPAPSPASEPKGAPQATVPTGPNP